MQTTKITVKPSFDFYYKNCFLQDFGFRKIFLFLLLCAVEKVAAVYVVVVYFMHGINCDNHITRGNK